MIIVNNIFITKLTSKGFVLAGSLGISNPYKPILKACK